ncbi:hypothetical protein CFRS1_v006712 [Colletotrichum fructicola]|nr:hypothetical protein CFRS1_v006712 [Colletotrichum fructicola]
MDIDPTRGCSVPIPERSQYLESFWTAPSSGPQCSPPVSPKTLPEHVQPSMLRLDEHHGPAPGPTNGLSGGGGAVPSPYGLSTANSESGRTHAPSIQFWLALLTSSLSPMLLQFQWHLLPKFQPIPQRMLPPMARLKLAPAAIVLRQEPKDLVGNVWRRAAMPSTANVPGAAQTSMSSSTIQQHWPHMLGINPYANPMAGAMYGPLLQQSMMAGPNSAFALPQQQYPHGMPAQQSAGHMLPMAPTSTQPVAPTYSSSQRNPYLQTPSSAKPAKPAAPKATDPPQLTTKHIIVDIADTCLNVFPFEEVAKRHNQPEQKVRDIFGAVIQVPLLRCNTDKRRAGKLGTARVKEFNQAKKDAQAQVSSNQSKQDAMAQGPYMPSAWEMAQFMGPSDVRLGMFNNQFTGPW